MSEGLDRLAEELGGPPPESFERLDPGDAEALARALATARRDQQEALNEAMEHGLRFIPRLLRKPVTNALFG